MFAAGITRSQYVHDALGSTIVQVWRGPPDFDQAGRIEQLAFVKQLAGADRYPVFYLAKSMGSRIAMLRDEAADKWRRASSEEKAGPVSQANLPEWKSACKRDPPRE